MKLATRSPWKKVYANCVSNFLQYGVYLQLDQSCIFIFSFVYLHTHCAWQPLGEVEGTKQIYFSLEVVRRGKRMILVHTVPREFDINPRVALMGKKPRFPVLKTLLLESQPSGSINPQLLLTSRILHRMLLLLLLDCWHDERRFLHECHVIWLVLPMGWQIFPGPLDAFLIQLSIYYDKCFGSSNYAPCFNRVFWQFLV
jgi:hypothetical protein